MGTPLPKNLTSPTYDNTLTFLNESSPSLPVLSPSRCTLHAQYSLYQELGSPTADYSPHLSPALFPLPPLPIQVWLHCSCNCRTQGSYAEAKRGPSCIPCLIIIDLGSHSFGGQQSEASILFFGGEHHEDPVAKYKKREKYSMQIVHALNR